MVARLTTSQFVTAPKRREGCVARGFGLTTSQFVTAPKQTLLRIVGVGGLTTSQFVTAPKLTYSLMRLTPV